MEPGKRDRIFGNIAAAAGIIMLCAVLVLTVYAARNMAGQYHRLLEADLAQPLSGSISYSDHLYGEMGFGISTDPSDPAAPEYLRSFLADSVARIDQRILSCGVIYTMIICAVFAYPLYLKNRYSLKKHFLSILVLTVAVFISYNAAVIITFSAKDIPFYYPDVFRIMLICIGLISVITGLFALGMLLRTVKLKKLASIAAVPLTVLLFSVSAVFQAGLFSPPLTDSFSYVYEIEEKLLEPGYNGAFYDEERNILVVEGREYPPRQVENDEHYRGTARMGACAFDVLDPFSGSSLSLVQEIVGDRIPASGVIMHVLLPLIWMAAVILIYKKTHKPFESLKGDFKMKALVTYFSASGVTSALAKRLADAIGADVYEIRPETPYTEADLNWRDKQSRSTIEMQDKDSRPALADTDAPVADADVVFVGYPVWWYREPSVVDTFLEAYDFTGKKIALFATSGSSGIGEEAPARAAEFTKAEVVAAKRFAADAAPEELADWAKQFLS